VRVGMEATGYSRWFERLLAELGFELWIGDPAEIKAKRVKKQKFDREDARLILRLMRPRQVDSVNLCCHLRSSIVELDY
jgi:transposase